MWQSSQLCALDTLECLLIQSMAIKKVREILFSWGEKQLNYAKFATCPPSIFSHSHQVNSAFNGPKFWAGDPKCLLIQSMAIKKVREILFSWGEKQLNYAKFATCPPSIFSHSHQVNSAFNGPKFWAGDPKFCTGPLICTSSNLTWY